VGEERKGWGEGRRGRGGVKGGGEEGVGEERKGWGEGPTVLFAL
jgi:hypothetical protein